MVSKSDTSMVDSVSGPTFERRVKSLKTCSWQETMLDHREGGGMALPQRSENRDIGGHTFFATLGSSSFHQRAERERNGSRDATIAESRRSCGELARGKYVGVMKRTRGEGLERTSFERQCDGPHHTPQTDHLENLHCPRQENIVGLLETTDIPLL